MHNTLLRVAAIATLLSLTACALMETQPEEPPEVKSASPSWNESNAATTVKPAPGPTVTLAKPDNRDEALLAHKQSLQKTGAALLDEDVGYYMDIHEARYIQLVRDDRVGMLRQDDTLSLIISGGDSFASNSARLRPEMEGVLKAIAQVLEEYQDTRIIISGHTDDTGEEAYNQHLAERRARTMSRYLTKSGVAAERIVIIGYGEAQPLADNTSAKGRAANRRIEILLEPLTR
jgi:outer membrane protein OmpA-like peptidoglycan-associated protein